VVSVDSFLEGLTKKQLETAVGILALDKGVDLVTGGRLNKLTKKVLMATARRLVPMAGRAGLSVAGTALGVSRLAMMNPYILGGTAIYVGYHERDKIRSLLEQGYEIVEEKLSEARLPAVPTPGIPSPTIPGVSDIITAGTFPPMTMLRGKRKSSSFNIAVGKGMKAVKRSTKYGGKGKISPAKKVFAMVTKLASAKKKKRKAPKSGIRRTIWNAMKGLR